MRGAVYAGRALSLRPTAVCAAVAETGAIVTAEEHSIIGGLGSAVMEAVASAGPVPVVRVGLDDRFAETGPYFELVDRYGMSVADIVAAARQAMRAKERAA